MGITCIGLFQGMFEGNLLTFNPAGTKMHKCWMPSPIFASCIQALKAQGVEMADESVNSDLGPASFTLIDPDGNAILIDQHV
jgi:hypothetical protein